MKAAIRRLAFQASRITRSTRRLVLHFDPSDRRTPSDLSQAAFKFLQLTRVYHLITVYVILNRRSSSWFKSTPTDSLWPIDLVTELTGGYVLANISTTIALCASAMAILAASFPRMLIWRLGVFLYFFYFNALVNSYGFPAYDMRVYVYTSFALLFLPSISNTRKMSHRNVLACLAVFWLTQSLLLVKYVLSGFWKIWDSGMEIFAIDGMTRILISRALSDDLDIPLLLPVVAPHAGMTQLMYLIIIYVEISAIFIVFRPHLHRPLGIVLLLLHWATDWTLNVKFPNSLLIVGLFLVLSPMAPKRFSLSGFIQSLPVIGIPFRALTRFHSSDYQERVEQVWLIYDGKGPIVSSYARRLAMNETVDVLTLVNTNEDEGPLVQRSLPSQYSGTLILKMNERFYTGNKAIRRLALRSKSRGIFGMVNRIILTAPLGALACHALLKLESLLFRGPTRPR